MARQRQRQHTRDFKLAALARMDTAPDVKALARELGIERALLYRWQRTYISGGAAALRSVGRSRPMLMQPPDPGLAAEEKAVPAVVAATNPAPAACLAAQDPAAAARRIAELERKIGQQQLDLDFFRAALRHVRDRRR